MCGIAGALDLNKSRSHDDLVAIATGMGAALHHRGPDDAGIWVDPESGFSCAHQRLSILDLSAAGHQPMISASGRYVLVYNGEIYNFAELRSDLEAQGDVFTGHSDSEVLLAALARWGVAKTLPRLIGMFAFALWDRELRTLSLARDRLGVKPLYWGRQGGHVFFCSELKSLRSHPDFKAEVNPAALSDLVAFNYIAGPASIYAGIEQLEPGTYVHIDPQGDVEANRYWDVLDIAARAHAQAKTGRSEEEAVQELEQVLGDAVKSRMIADVPLGAFLSGGIDSSLIAALMQKASTSPIQTFTIGFGEDEFNEAGHARSVAEHLGTEHHEFQVSGRDALDVIPKLASMYCEPFADSSQIPTHLVSVLARGKVAVALSGDGGDEVFGGYNRYLAASSLWPRFAWAPVAARRALAQCMKSLPHAAYDGLARVLPENRRPSQLDEKIRKLADMLASRDLDDFYAGVVRFWEDPRTVVVGGVDNPAWWERVASVKLEGPVERMQAIDMLTYLPGDILTKVDRASMAVGLEARVPLLDHRVVEFAWSLPPSMKIRDGQTKWLLRKALERYVPRDLMERPKMGFSIPLGDWLRGPLRDWAEDLLSERSLADTGLFHPGPVREKWRRHLNGQHHEHYALWSILMAQDWYRSWMKGI